jgi:hypothetical protein
MMALAPQARQRRAVRKEGCVGPREPGPIAKAALERCSESLPGGVGGGGGVLISRRA